MPELQLNHRRIFWRKNCRNQIIEGQQAGWLDHAGYRMITIDGSYYKASRLAWFFEYKVWPRAEIDHRNTKRDDNAIGNLREATRAQNCQNTNSKGGASGIKGVRLHRGTGKWEARVGHEQKQHYLGLFETKEAAAAAYAAAAKRLHGDFARVS